MFHVFFAVVNMVRFYDLVEKEIPTFRGLKYTNGDMEIAVALMKEGRNLMLGSDTILWGALHLGFDAAILTTLSICPETIRDVYDNFLKNKTKEGREAQLKLNNRIKEILSHGTGEWVECMKNEFNRVHKTLNAGTTRKPIITHNVKRK